MYPNFLIKPSPLCSNNGDREGGKRESLYRKQAEIQGNFVKKCYVCRRCRSKDQAAHDSGKGYDWKNVKTIGKKAFYSDRKLMRIVYKGAKITKMGKKAFRGVPKKVNLQAPAKAVKKYTKMMNAAF